MKDTTLAIWLGVAMFTVSVIMWGFYFSILCVFIAVALWGFR